MAIIETLVDPEFDERFPAKPLLSFGCRASESEVGAAMVYWRFSTRALEDMLMYAGFAETRRQKSFGLPPGEDGRNQGLTEPTPVTVVVAYPTPRRAMRRQSMSVPDSKKPSVLKAGMRVVGGKPTNISAGARYSFQVEVTNLGDTIWLASPNSIGGFVQLGAGIRSESACFSERDYGRGRLIADVYPGEKQIVDMLLQAPKEPGIYYVMFDMVCEGISWFAQQGSHTLEEKIEVLNSPS
jgi:hypothetical protein